MPEAFVQLPADSTGKKLRTFERTVGANTVHDQFVQLSEGTAWYIWVTPQVQLLNKIFLAVLNTAVQKIALRGLWLVRDNTAQTGAAVQFDVKKITALIGGTAVTPVIMDSTDAALSGVTSVHTPTSATEGAVYFTFFTNSEETIATTSAMSLPVFTALTNLIPDIPAMKTPRFNQNEGFCVKQTTGLAAGNWSVLAAITLES